MKKSLSLKSRIQIFGMVTAIVPLSISSWRVLSDSENVKEDTVSSFGEYAISLIDTIERNLFERYGDAQAFAANEVILNATEWGNRDEAKNATIRAMNAYMDLSDAYTIMLAVDLEGNPIAVNTRDANGKPVDNEWAFSQNYKNAKWFRDCIDGKFLKGSGTDGTVVEDIHIDPLVKRIRNDAGLAIGFTAPIRDLEGKTIGAWTNRVSFELVEQILIALYSNLKAGGYETAELTLLDKEGRVIAELDPSSNAGAIAANRDPAVILKLNLAKEGVEAAKNAIAGEHGAVISNHARKGIDQVAGYAHSHGALGYKGLGWSILARIDEAEAMGSFAALNLELAVIFVLSIISVSFFAWRLSNKISGPIARISKELSQSATQARTSSEIVDQNARALANGSTEQAANVEETSSSSEELNAMTAQNTENVSKALHEVENASRVVEISNQQLHSLIDAMSEISSASDETKNIIKTIDEIAFQTNILALNAAVEAARAGEAGAGFAIVADEVRNLAERTAVAAKDTSVLIDQNIEKISKGSATAKETNEGFHKLLDATRGVEALMGEIDVASQQQREGLSQINVAVTQISEITQQNAAGSEEVASAAQELNGGAAKISSIARELESLITGKAGEQAASPKMITEPIEDDPWSEPLASGRRNQGVTLFN